MKFLALTILVWCWCVQPVWAAAISHPCITPVTTEDTHTGDTAWTDVTGASIGSGSLTAGRPYFVIGTLMQSETGSGLSAARLVHGSTAFTESQWYQLQFSSQRMTIMFFDLWTAVSSEGLKWQHLINNSANTVGSDMVTLCALDFNDLSATDDYRYNESTSSTGLTTTYAGFATVTFTPSTTEKWAVFYYCQITSTSTNPYKCRLNQSGVSTTPEDRIDHNVNSLTYGLAQTKIVTLTASTSYTFTVEAASEVGSANTHEHSKIMLIRCGVWSACDGAWNDAQQALSTTDFATQLGTVSITPGATSDVLVCGSARYEVVNSQYMNMRIQHANTTNVPGTQTYDFVHQDRADTSNRVPVNICTMVNSLAASSQTFDLDSSITATSGNASHAGILAFTMELASTSRRPIGPIIFGWLKQFREWFEPAEAHAY